MKLGTAQVIRADSRHLPLADNSVDLVVTSPPYFALRSYQDGGEHYEGQVGSEGTPAEFVDALLEVTRECVRVLKPSGSLWVNLGDKYSGAPSGPRQGMPDGATRKAEAHIFQERRKVEHAIPQKSLMGIPWRYALRCIDDLGLILRAEVIWSKPNGLPESVTDRVRRSHETWFHFTLEPRYFSAVDEIREASDPNNPRERYATRHKAEGWTAEQMRRQGFEQHPNFATNNPLGKLPGSVWTIPTEPLRVPDHLGIDHFAAFPTEFPRRIIQGWSPAGICVECGEGRRPVTGHTPEWTAFRQENGMSGFHDHTTDETRGHHASSRGAGLSNGAIAAFGPKVAITGYACACDPDICRSCTRSNGPLGCIDFRCCDSCTHGTQADTRPAVILDPFGGTGTTAMVAKALGRHGISVDMSADYCRLAEWRTNDRNQLAKVLGIEKTEEPDVDQLDLFGGEVA